MSRVKSSFELGRQLAEERGLAKYRWPIRMALVFIGGFILGWMI